MYIVQIGHRSLNMDFLVQAEDAELEPEPKQLPAGAVRVTMALGRPFDVQGGDAAKMRRVLLDLVVESDQPRAERKPRSKGGRRVLRAGDGIGSQSVPSVE